MHEAMAATLDTAVETIKKIQQDPRVHGKFTRPRWPMIVLNSPKGWTGPKMVDGLQVEGTFRSHQVPLSVDAAHPDHLQQLEAWMKSYRPEEFFDERGRLKPELAELAPTGERRAARILTSCCRPSSTKGMAEPVSWTPSTVSLDPPPAPDVCTTVMW
jgi:xylulose-5-phosphate/fructose-6-phosphate phosphoketolase